MSGHCRNKCEQLPFVIPGRSPWKVSESYGNGLKRCTTCAYYAKGTNLYDGFRCPCCRYKLRSAPHSRTKILKITTRVLNRI